MTRISWLSFAAILLLLPVGRTAELALVVCVVAALGAWARGAEPSWRGAHARLLLALFAAYWLPSLCSAWDSVQLEQSWRTTAGALRFGLLALVPLLWAERRTELLPRLQNACAWIAGLWALDALVQAATGLSAGGWAHGERISSERTERVLMDGEHILRSIGAVQHADKADEMRREFRRLTNQFFDIFMNNLAALFRREDHRL